MNLFIAKGLPALGFGKQDIFFMQWKSKIM